MLECCFRQSCGWENTRTSFDRAALTVFAPRRYAEAMHVSLKARRPHQVFPRALHRSLGRDAREFQLPAAFVSPHKVVASKVYPISPRINNRAPAMAGRYLLAARRLFTSPALGPSASAGDPRLRRGAAAGIHPSQPRSGCGILRADNKNAGRRSPGARELNSLEFALPRDDILGFKE